MNDGRLMNMLCVLLHVAQDHVLTHLHPFLPNWLQTGSAQWTGPTRRHIELSMNTLFIDDETGHK